MSPAIATFAPAFEVRVVTHNDTGTLTSQALRDSVLSISVQKRLSEPAGAFSLILAPRRRELAGGGTSSWHDVLQPMSFVEIALWTPPRDRRVVMRGFVDVVEDRFTIEGGRPVRRIAVLGRDYGKLLLTTRLYWHDAFSEHLELFQRWQAAQAALLGWGAEELDLNDPAALPGEPNLPRPHAPPGRGTRYRVQFTPGEMQRLIWNGFMAPRLEDLTRRYAGDVPVPALAFEQGDDEDTLRTIDPVFVDRAVQPFIDVWSLMRRYQHDPWRELFFDEGEEGPLLRYRPAPWLDLNGDYVQGRAASVDEWQLEADQIIDYALARSDAAIANLFLTRPQGFDAFAMAAKAYPEVGTGLEGVLGGERLKGNPYLVDTDDQGYRLHGLRVMEVATPFFDVDQDLRATTIAERITEIVRQGKAANIALARAHDHGAWLEAGHLTIRGDERIRPGHYVKQPERGARLYVEGVAHHFRQGTQPGDGTFRTVLEVGRGRGHIARAVGGAP